MKPKIDQSHAFFIGLRALVCWCACAMSLLSLDRLRSSVSWVEWCWVGREGGWWVIMDDLLRAHNDLRQAQQKQLQLRSKLAISPLCPSHLSRPFLLSTFSTFFLLFFFSFFFPSSLSLPFSFLPPSFLAGWPSPCIFG